MNCAEGEWWDEFVGMWADLFPEEWSCMCSSPDDYPDNWCEECRKRFP